MTDTPQGPVWKSPSPGAGAAAGRPLPPPGSRPVAPAAPPTQPLARQAPLSPPLRSVSSGLSGTLQGFFWATCGLAVVAALLAVGNLLAFNTWWDTPVGSPEEAEALDDWIRVEDALAAVTGVMGFVVLVVFVLLIIWANSAHKASQELWAGDRKWSSGWTVAGWFIPFGNLVIPKLVLNEIERIAFAPRTFGRVGAGWRSTATSAVGWMWWLPMVVGALLGAAGDLLVGEPDSSAAVVRLGYVLNSAGLTLFATGTAAGAIFVRRLTSRLTAEGLRQQS